MKHRVIEFIVRPDGSYCRKAYRSNLTKQKAQDLSDKLNEKQSLPTGDETIRSFFLENY